MLRCLAGSRNLPLMAIWSILAPILGNVITNNASKVIDNFVTNKDDAEQAKRELEREIKLGLLEQSEAIQKQAGDIILAEAKSEHWLTANWRPLLMLVIIGIVAWNYLVVGIALTLGLQVMPLDLPEQLWTLLQIGVGGYVVGRSGEKMVTKMMEKK